MVVMRALKRGAFGFMHALVVFFTMLFVLDCFDGEEHRYFGIAFSGPYGTLLACAAGHAIHASMLGIFAFAFYFYQAYTDRT